MGTTSVLPAGAPSAICLFRLPSDSETTLEARVYAHRARARKNWTHILRKAEAVALSIAPSVPFQRRLSRVPRNQAAWSSSSFRSRV